jgi:hypothetical protein
MGQVGIVSNMSQLLTQVREGGKIMPLSEQMIDWRSQQPTVLHSFTPFWRANGDDGVLVWKQPKIPGGTKPSQKINALS